MKHTGEFNYPIVEHIDQPAPLDLLNDELRTSTKGDQFRAQTLTEFHAIYKDTPLAERMVAFATTLPTLTLSNIEIGDLERDSRSQLRPQAFYHGSLLAIRTCLVPLSTHDQRQILYYDWSNQVVRAMSSSTEKGARVLNSLAVSFDAIDETLQDQSDDYHFAILQAAEYAAYGFEESTARIYETDFITGYTYTAGYITNLHEALSTPPQEYPYKDRWFA